jgi:hypothetical protein
MLTIVNMMLPSRNILAIPSRGLDAARRRR